VLILAVSSSPISAYPPDPDNAALLYYQAFLSYQKPDDTVRTMIRDLTKGEIELNEEIKDYIPRCRLAMEFAAIAAEIPKCDWGLRYSEGYDMVMNHLGQYRDLSRIIIAKAKILAAEGDYKAAIERCLTAVKMARHSGDETVVSLLVAKSIGGFADKCIQGILADMPGDLKVLTHLRDQLEALSKKPLSFRKTLEIEREVGLEAMHVEKIGNLIQAFAAGDGDKEDPLEKFDELHDEAVLKKCRDYYANHMARLLAILDSQSPYTETYEQLNKLSEQPHKDMARKPEAALTAGMVPALFKSYARMLAADAYSNAVRAAIEVYIVNAKTGQLPKRLPSGSPKDLFSGKDFEYEKTKNGFILRCRAKDLDKGEICEYEFKIKK
jgi:hypothetical protein